MSCFKIVYTIFNLSFFDSANYVFADGKEDEDIVDELNLIEINIIFNKSCAIS